MKKVLASLLLFPLLLLAVPTDAQQTTFNKRAVISISSSGSNTVIPAVSGQRIMIFGLDLSCASPTTVQLLDGATPLTGAMSLTAYSKPVVMDTAYWVGTNGNAFNISLGGAVSCAGAVWYSQQP